MLRKAAKAASCLIPPLPDTLSVAGLFLLGYGLYLLYPWLSFTVCGALLLLGGILLGRNERRRDP